jgi:hypothetical protein
MEGERIWEEILEKRVTSSLEVKLLLDKVALKLCYTKNN